MPLRNIGSFPLSIIQPLRRQTSPGKNEVFSAPENKPPKNPPGILRETLPSGLRLVVAERPRAALTAILLRVGVGSGSETPENNGSAHAIEHLIFKGGKDSKPGDRDLVIERLGGEFSARTTRDFTEFSTTVLGGNTAAALKVVADLVREPAFRADDWERERQVIRAEMAAARSDVARIGYGQIAAALYGPDSPYRLPLMGTPEGLERLTVDSLRAFWQTWYQPENITLVVVGPMSGEEVKKAVAALFPKEREPAPVTTVLRVSIPPLGEIIHAPPVPLLEQPEREFVTLQVAFRAPAGGDADTLPAFDAMVPLLAGGSSGRLYTRLVAMDRLAVNADAVFLPGRLASMILLTLTVLPIRAAKLEKAVEDEIRRMREDTLSPGQADTAKAIARSRARYEAETVEGRARHLATLEYYAPELTEEAYLEKVDSLTPDEMKKNVLRYLTPLSYAVATVGPPPPAPETAPGGTP